MAAGIKEVGKTDCNLEKECFTRVTTILKESGDKDNCKIYDMCCFYHKRQIIKNLQVAQENHKLCDTE